MHKLEKLNSSIDIIPLQSPSMDINAGRRMMKPTEKARLDEAQGRIFRDPMIISRVRTYLYENEDKVYIDVTEMADHLQRKYRDYRGKKRGPFRAMVRRAYDEITENLTRQADAHWQDDEDEIDIEVDAMPAEYLQTYKRQMSGRQNGNSSDKELIDISSDDDQAPKTCTTTSSKLDKDSMEIETTQVIKRPHLSPSIEAKSINQQSQELMDIQVKSSRSEKSRKRPREKDSASPFEVTRKKPKDRPVVNPTVTFANVGGNYKVLETVAKLLRHMKHPEIHTELRISPPRGFLLHGPPGCGKTLLAGAIAGELKIPLLKVAAPELVAGVSGESEQRIRELFEQAIAIAPCVLFIDEIDALAPQRANAQKEMEKRIVGQLISCLDELKMKDNGNKVLVLGATNMPDSLDPALRRAGRFDREICLGIPDRDARTAILEVLTAHIKLSPDIDLKKIALLTPGFVGADLVALITEAAMAAVERTFDDLEKNVNVEVAPAEVIQNDNEIVEEEKEKPVEIVEPEITDVVIEEPPVEPVEPAETPENTETKEDQVTENQVEEVPASTEEPKKSEEQTETPEISEATPAAEPTVEETPISEKPVEEEVQPEPSDAPVIEATDVPIASPEITPEPIETVEPPTNIQENDAIMQVEEPGKKLADILAWLHNETPLTKEQLDSVSLKEEDFETALQHVQPSSKREGFATVPNVTWDDIGSLQDIREELKMAILGPIRYPEESARYGLTAPSGVLLCGPPGCGKTLLAKAVANEAGINFISVKGPELLNMYVGESERAVRQCFTRARNSAPCVIFFDELDALVPRRTEGDNSATSRVVNQMLTEMDGVDARKDVFLMGASNRPDIIDPAVLRPGRFDTILYVGLPNTESKWHQNLPLKFVTHCLQDLKNPKNIIMLGLLLEGEILSKTISQVIPEIPGIKADDIDDSQFCEIMASLPVAIDITNPAVNLEILEKFCRGDLVRYAARSVVKVSQRVPLPKAKLFAKKLITKPVSVQRYGFFMFLRFANNDERLEFLAYAVKNLTHPSIHNIVVKKILHFFGTSPSQATWKLMKICIDSLTADDQFLLEAVCKNYRYTSIENEFAGLFYIELFYKIEKLAKTGDLDEGTKNDRISLIFRSMQHVKRFKGLPDEACEDILNRYLLQTDFINRINEDTGILNFALNAYLWETSDKFEYRWNVVSQFLSLAVKNWNEKDSKDPKKYPARYAIHKFFQEFLYLFETHTLSLKLYPKSIELILNVFSTILSPWQEMSSYLKLYFYNLYSDNTSWKNYGIKCGESFPILVKEFSGELILEKVTESFYYVVKSTSLGWDKQCENLFDIMEGLCEVNNHYAAIVCIKILKDIYITHISADTSLNDRFLGIIDCLNKNDNISVKYILNDYMNEYFRVQ